MKGDNVLKEQGHLPFPVMPDLKVITEQCNTALKHMFEGKIKGYFLIDVKDQVMKAVIVWICSFTVCGGCDM